MRNLEHRSILTCATVNLTTSLIPLTMDADIITIETVGSGNTLFEVLREKSIAKRQAPGFMIYILPWSPLLINLKDS